MGTYKQARSRKLLGAEKLRLRLQDAIESIEPVFLGEKDTDYDPEVVQLRMKGLHAIAAAIGAYQRLENEFEFNKRLEELETVATNEERLKSFREAG